MAIVKCKGVECEACQIGWYEKCHLEKIGIRTSYFKLNDDTTLNFTFNYSKQYLENNLYEHLKDVIIFSSNYIH